MAVDIKVPSVGESITQGTISRWLKKDGAQVRLDEPLFELETEKATQEVPAPAAGVLHIAVAEGQGIAIGSVVGTIEAAAAPAGDATTPTRPQRVETEAETAKAPVPPAATTPPSPAKRSETKPEADNVPVAVPSPPSPKRAETKADADGKPVSPAARRLATEEGVDVKQVAGTGRGGVVLKTDVQEHLNQNKPAAQEQPVVPAAPAPSTAGGRETRQRMSAIRQRIAERLLASQRQTASLTTFNEADMAAIMELRTRYKEKFIEEHGIGLGFMAFFVKAAVQALKAYPLVNARMEDADIILQHYYNIGVAVSTEKGLMVPVLRDADAMTFAQIEQAVAAMADKARAGKISVADLQGGTFTITNGGIFGSMMSTPILNPPQSAILGMHSIQKRPVVRGDQIVIRPMMYLALTYDHRLIDGREAVLFLVRVKECLEDPERLLLEI